MAINYDWTVMDILGFLGYGKEAGKPYVDEFERGHNVKLPVSLADFISITYKRPVFKNSDMWLMEGQWICFLYETIECDIEEIQQKDNPEEWADEMYDMLSGIPKEKWQDYIEDYLQLGSDYAAGVAIYGIRKKDMDKENPPVYIQIEDDSLTEWKYLCTLSEYLMAVLCDTLLCIEYGTAWNVLQEEGWTVREFLGDGLEEEAAKAGIDFSKAKRHLSLYAEKQEDRDIICCFDEEQNVLYLSRKYEKMYAISR